MGENYHDTENLPPRPTRLCTLLRQSNQLRELKCNLLENHSLNSSHRSGRHPMSPDDLWKRAPTSPAPLRHLSLSPSSIDQFQTQITDCLHACTSLIDSIASSTVHRRCWSQLLLTHLIERRCVDLEFVRCSQVMRNEQASCANDGQEGVLEDDAWKLSSILRRGSRLNMDSIVFDHLRRIIVLKSLQEGSCERGSERELLLFRPSLPVLALDHQTSLRELYLKQLTSLKQCLAAQQSWMETTKDENRPMGVISVYSKLLLFLSSLYSIKAETMQTLFCQHLRHNPTYSYLIT